MTSDLNIYHRKIYNFVSFPLFKLNFSEMLIFKVMEILSFFIKKDDVRFEYVLSNSL